MDLTDVMYFILNTDTLTDAIWVDFLANLNFFDAILAFSYNEMSNSKIMVHAFLQTPCIA